MKRKIGFVLIGMTLFFGSALYAQMSKSQMQQMYMTYLKEQGYQPEVDSDGDIAFKAEGRTLYIIVDEDDLGTFRIMYPNFWEIESEAERRQVAQAASLVIRTTKMARVYMTSNNDTTIDVYTLVLKPEDFKSNFKRMLDILFLARRKFIDEMNK